MEGDRDRERLFRGWQALREACRKQHEPGPGAAAICICGASCGGSEACGMLWIVRETFRHMPVDTLPIEWQQQIEALRRDF